MAKYCNVFVRESNRTLVPWSVVSVEPTVTFAGCFLDVKSGKFSNISTSLELSSSVLHSVYIGQDKVTANSIVEKAVNVVSVCSVFGWHVKFIVSVPEQGESSSQHVFKNAFSIMMESQCCTCAQTLPEAIPSLIKRKKTKSITYSPAEQHARNVGLVIQCDECDKWRLLFSKRKLSVSQRKKLEEIITDVSYSCGATTDDLLLPETLAGVGVQTHDCGDPIEKIYFSAYKNDPLCIHCGSTNNLTIPKDEDNFYHYCDECSMKERILK